MDDSDEDFANDSDEAPIITKAPEPKKKNKKGKKNDEKDDDNNDENMTEAAPAEGENYFLSSILLKLLQKHTLKKIDHWIS